MTTLIMVRHGQSQANLEEYFAGHTNAQLTEVGISQAKLTAQYLKENYNISKVYASDLSRAFETGRCISDIFKTEIIPVRNLREIYAGKWEGKAFDTITKAHKNDYSLWLNDIGNAKCTEGESVAELAERVFSALTQIAKENDGKTVAIATHATPIRVTQSIVQTGSLDEMKNIPWVTNASVSELEYRNGKWIFTKVSMDKHLAAFATPRPTNV
ncbi:MAG: histidine phosphatase family protein [Clostridia bacterium]|nr:histidine phosphatase family protein [Clostridia bacterium]